MLAAPPEQYAPIAVESTRGASRNADCKIIIGLPCEKDKAGGELLKTPVREAWHFYNQDRWPGVRLHSRAVRRKERRIRGGLQCIIFYILDR
jgi:hypothetical protein